MRLRRRQAATHAVTIELTTSSTDNIRKPQLNHASSPAPIPQTCEASPCDDCRYRQKCAGERLACEAFSMYIHGTRQVRWRAAPRAPTRARYLALRLDR